MCKKSLRVTQGWLTLRSCIQWEKKHHEGEIKTHGIQKYQYLAVNGKDKY